MQSIAGIPVRQRDLSSGGITVRIFVTDDLEAHIDREALLSESDIAEPPYWMHLWPAAATLARRVADSKRIGPGVKIIELGCGLGLPALIGAARGAFVVATDWKRSPLQFARASARLNDRVVEVLQMDWAAPALQRDFDLCLGADVAYDRSAEEPLVSALTGLLRPGGTAWLADSVNVHRSDLVDCLSARGLDPSVSWHKEREDGRTVWVRLIETTVRTGVDRGSCSCAGIRS